MKKRDILGLIVAVLAMALCPVPASATLLLHETFDYANDSGLALQVDVGATGTWFGNSFENTPAGSVVLNGDTGGDNGTASLAFPGIEGSGGRMSAPGTIFGNSYIFYPTPVTGEGNSVYVSFLFKPKRRGTSWIVFNATALISTDVPLSSYPSWPVDDNAPAGINAHLGRFDQRNTNDPDATLAARWVTTGSRVIGPALTIDQTYFIVMKTTMVAGADNDTVEFFVDPVADGTEPGTPTVATAATAGSGNDVSATSGFLGVGFRMTTNSSGEWELDELRAGTTWADVTSSLGAAGDGDGDGDGGAGSTATPEAGMPVTGALGLGLVAAACALGGSMFLRKK